MNITEVHSIRFPRGTSGVCEVIAGPTQRVFRATPHAIGMALIGASTPEDAANVSAGEIIWQDYLASNGVAVGTRGKQSYTLVVVPSRERTVRYTGPIERPTDNRSLTCLFPPMLIGIRKDGTGTRSFKKGVVFCLNAGALGTLSVTGTAAVGTHFPYGNVYIGSGYICWGSVPHGHIQTVKDLEELFFGSDFNGDLYSGSGRLNTLVQAYKGKVLPLVAANTSVPAMIRSLAG